MRKGKGEGLVAYYWLHRWFVKTTGPALHEEMKKVMNPTPVAKDVLLLGHLEEWELTVSKLEKYCADYALSTMVRINALEIMMSARQAVYEAIERSIPSDKVDQKDRLQYILTQCKQYASRRKPEVMMRKGQDAAPMDLGEIEQRNQHYQPRVFNQGWSNEGQPVTSPTIDAMTKGGKGGKSGKGFQGSCFVCGECGHLHRFCQHQDAKGKGKAQYGKSFGKGGWSKGWQ